jgi:hypothetical protein
MPYLFGDEVAQALLDHNLPDLPDAADDDDPEGRMLILYRQNQTNIVIHDWVSLEDAKAYCNRQDTSGEGWFVGFDKP